MTAVHVWREEERQGMHPPQLEVGDHRVGDLTGVLDVVDYVRCREASGPLSASGAQFGHSGSPTEKPWLKSATTRGPTRRELS